MFRCRTPKQLRKFRARFSGFPNALKPPFVTRGDTMSASTFWHGSKMDEWANAWTRYYTGGKGNYMIAGMEDSGTLQALTFLNQAGRVDLQRVLVLRTVSNYDREAPGTTVADSLKEMVVRQLLGLYAGPGSGAVGWRQSGAGHRRALGRSRIQDSARAVGSCLLTFTPTMLPVLRPAPASRAQCLRETRTRQGDGCIRCGRG